MAYVHLQPAGALRLQVQILMVKECYFYNNSNLKGGAILLNKNENFEENYVSIENCVFKMNEAGDSGASISFDQNINFIEGNITKCYFFDNLAWCMLYFDFF